MNENIVISTIYSYEPVIAGAIELGAKRLILLKDDQPPKEQEEAIEKVKLALSNYVQIETISTSIYDIYKVASDVVDLIDSFDESDSIFLNISAGRKPKSLGLMFAGYARSSKVNKIIYVTKEEKEVVTLPNMPFNLTEKQKKVLSHFIGVTPKLKDVYKSSSISRASLFLMMKDFKRKGYMEEDNKISTCGKIALL